VSTKPTHIRLTEEERARAERIAEDSGASGYAGGIRVALLDSERMRGLAEKKPAVKKKGAVKE
jgi:hypothetical protein